MRDQVQRPVVGNQADGFARARLCQRDAGGVRLAFRTHALPVGFCGFVSCDHCRRIRFLLRALGLVSLPRGFPRGSPRLVG